MTEATELIDFHGLPALRISAPDGATAVVTLHGAHVVSWIPARYGERLYLSETSSYAAGAAIRGGVPVIFPRFGTEAAGLPAPRHGFARTASWECVTRRKGGDFALATLRLEASEATRAQWPYDFAADLTVCVSSNRLDLELDVQNTGNEAFAFTAALHTYLRVSEVELARLEGLRGLQYRDQVLGGERWEERRDALMVSDEVDRIYLNVSRPLHLLDGSTTTRVSAEGFPDVVVWNPWESKCAALADMPDAGFRRMLCVEAAQIAAPVNLAPGEDWFGRQTLAVGNTSAQ